MITRYIYPLWLREKISYRLRNYLIHRLQTNETSLFFAPDRTIKLCPTDVGHQSILFNGFYELALSQHIVQLAKSGGMLVDVGANYGYYSVLWLAQNLKNQAVTFEAAPANWEALNNNLERNQLKERVVQVPKALSDRPGWIDFDPHQTMGQTGWGGISLQQTPGTIQVPAVTLDDYWTATQGTQPIHVLKIDVEGADTLVLEGAEQLLKAQQIRHIFFEVNRPRMALLQIAPDRAETLLKKYGYQIEAIDHNEMHAYL